MKKIISFFVFLVLFVGSISAKAVTKALADSAYVKENYSQAANIYEQLLKKGQSANLYYNLGNAYYKGNDIPRAVLNYERAYLFDPGNSDIRFNLTMARSKTIDKIVPSSEMFFVTWYRYLVHLTSVDGWAKAGVVCFVLFIALILVYLFVSKLLLRKIGFYGAVVMLICVVFMNLFAYSQKLSLVNRDSAIVITPAVTVCSTPSETGTELFVLHEGTKVRICDSSMKEWKEIELADGKVGWVKNSAITVI